MRSWFDWLEKTEPRGEKLYSVLYNVLTPGDVILDVACGMAPMAKHLKNHNYVGVDVNEDLINKLASLTSHSVHCFDVLSPDGALFVKDVNPTVLLLLGVTNHPHNQPGFMKMLEGLNPRVVLIEYAHTEVKTMPRMEAIEKIYSYLDQKGYGIVQIGQFDAELKTASTRMYGLLVKDYLPITYYDHRFEDPMFCRNDIYRLRNEALIMLLDDPPKRVFEFAGASGLLAEILLKAFPHIKFYHHSDISPRACKQAFEAMSRAAAETEATVYSETIDMVWNRPDLSKFDLVTTTSMEHLPKGTDLRILEDVAPGAAILFSLTSFGKTGHPHPFPTEEYIRSRYSGLINIEKLIRYDPLQVWLMKGVKR